MKIKTYEADVVVLNEEKGFAALKKAAESGRKLWDTEKIRVVIDKKVPPNSPEESKRQQEVRLQGSLIFLMRTGEEWLSICWWKSPSPRALLPYPEILTSM